MNQAPTTREQIADKVKYNPTTGKFTIVDSANVERKTCVANYNYFVIDGVLYRADYLACLIMTGETPLSIIAHLDGDPSNDRYENLKQGGNIRRFGEKTSTGVLGVYICGNKYRSAISMKTETGTVVKHLGVFNTIEEASAAFTEASAQRAAMRAQIKTRAP